MSTGSGPGLPPAISIAAAPPSVAGAAGIAAWIVFAVAGSLRILRDGAGHGTLTFHMPFIAAATILGGPVAGAWVAAVGTFDRRELREAPWYGVLANHAALTLSALAGGLVMEGLLGAASRVGLGDGPGPTVVAVAAGTVTMALASGGFAAGTIALRDGLSLRESLR